MKHLPFCLLPLMISCCTDTKGQTKNNLPADTIKSEIKAVVSSHGPGTPVRTIRQDRQGRIWLAAHEGVIRYDGKSFTNVTGNLTTDRYFFVLEDKKGNFWFAAYGSGVYHYDGQSFLHYTTGQGLVNNRVSVIYEDRAGNIWFGADGGVSRYDGNSFQNYLTEGGLASNDVNAIVEDKAGRLWFGTRGHTYTYDGKSFAQFTYKGAPFKNVWSIIEDKKGNMWFGGGSGLWRYEDGVFSNVARHFINNIYEDSKGNIWTSGSSGNSSEFGLTRYARNALYGKKPTATEIAQSPHVFRMWEAKDGSIWFGAVDGVYRYDGNGITDFKDKVARK